MGVGLALYLVASFYEMFSSEPIIKHTVKCKYCRKWISAKVSHSSYHSELIQRLIFGRQRDVSTARVGLMEERIVKYNIWV
jgi:hypothetical protein